MPNHCPLVRKRGGSEMIGRCSILLITPLCGYFSISYNLPTTTDNRQVFQSNIHVFIFIRSQQNFHQVASSAATCCKFCCNRLEVLPQQVRNFLATCCSKTCNLKEILLQPDENFTITAGKYFLRIGIIKKIIDLFGK